MDYTEKILSRADICNIKEFLLYGVEPLSDKNNKKTREVEYQKILGIINEKLAIEEAENLVNMISHLNSISEEIHFELGLKCGMKLQRSLFSES